MGARSARIVAVSNQCFDDDVGSQHRRIFTYDVDALLAQSPDNQCRISGDIRGGRSVCAFQTRRRMTNERGRPLGRGATLAQDAGRVSLLRVAGSIR